MAEEDPDLLAVTPAMPHGSCLTAFMDKYPERCFDVGIAESHSITYSGGLAWGGKKRVVASIYSSFLQRAMDNVFHDVCLQEIPLVIAIDRAGVSGGDGQMCNGVYDMGFLRSMPNMAICQPRNGTVLKELMNSAFDWGCPTAIRYPNLSAGDVDVARQTRALGKGELLLQGEGILLVPLGNMCASAQRVAEILHDAGLSCSIFDPIFVKPLDEEALGSLLKQHSHVVTMEEHSVHSGLGSAINNFLLQSDQMPSCVQNFGLPDHFVEQGSHSLLLDELGLSPEKMAAAIIERRGVKDRELLASMR
jgi:1-deoxy-D-xylulose-5-phosphate synthase